MKKKQHYKRFIIFLFAFLLWGVLTSGWGFVWYQSYDENIPLPFFAKGNWLVIAVYGLTLLLFSRIYGSFRIGYYKRSDVIFSGCLSVGFTNLITYFQTSLISRRLVEPSPILLLTIASFIVIWLWSGIAEYAYQKLYPPHQLLVIYGDTSPQFLIQKMLSRAEKYDICESISVNAGLDAVYSRIKDYEAVLICDVKSEYRNKILKHCYSQSVRVYITPKISDAILRGADSIHLFDTPLLLCRNQGLSFEQRLFKRSLDLVISTIGLILTGPFMLIVAAAIKLCDGGPVIYKQTRLTLGGATFSVYKFRSMIVDAEKHCGARLASENDDRITPVGKVIRKLRLDELPQIFNILKGDMSVVGPRPERPEIAKQYEEIMPEFSFRLKVKAGLTGYAQVLGKYNTTPYDKLKLDLMYIENYSGFLDLKLILMTFKTLFQKESTEGIDADRLTAAIPGSGVSENPKQQ